MPEKVSWIFGRMIADNWLIGYEFEERMEFTFEKVSNRVKNDHNMLTAIDDLRKHKAVLNDDFQRFFPDLLESTKVEFKKIVLDV
jgi:acyl carrier protein phosphodiesterase